MQRLKLAFITLFLIFTATALLVGCGAKQTAVQNVPVAPANTVDQPFPLAPTDNKVTVKIADFVFSPAVLELKTGTTVNWENNDSLTHAVVSDGLFASPDLSRGDTFTYTFSKPGTYDYYCKIHPTMKGRVTVTNP